MSRLVSLLFSLVKVYSYIAGLTDLQNNNK